MEISSENKVSLICITPTRNDIWVIERFLKAASLWADYIVIADQMSTDGSRDIIRSCPKAILVDNDCETYNELGRKRLLIDAARKIPGDKVLIALDVDEMFSPEVFTSGELETIKKLPKGTAVDFQWANFTANAQGMWYGYYFPWGYVDDGLEQYDEDISDTAIHCARVPISGNTPHYRAKSFKVIHFQYTDWDRMKHKHYMYQCQEVLSNPGKSAIEIYRQYHHMDTLEDKDMLEIPTEWITYYLKLGIDILKVEKEEVYWYDHITLRMMLENGAVKFRKISIWEEDWREIAKLSMKDIKSTVFLDPRNFYDRLVQAWMRWSQDKMSNKNVRRIDRIVNKLYGNV